MKPRSIFAVVAVMALVMVAVPVFCVDSSDATGTGTNSGTGTGTTEPAEYSGTCGTNLTWKFTVSSKTLVIEGTSSTKDCKLDVIGSWKITSPSNSGTTASKLLSDNKGFQLEVNAAKLTTLGTVFKES